MTEETLKKAGDLQKKIQDAQRLTQSLDNGYVAHIHCNRPTKGDGLETVTIHVDQELRHTILSILYDRVKKLEAEFKEL